MTKDQEIDQFLKDNEKGLDKIKTFIENGTFRKDLKVLGVIMPNSKKICVNYYQSVISRIGGPRQIEAAYHHCCNIIMTLEGKTDKQIQDHWRKKLKNKRS